jgi:hypothetical protein
MRTPRVTPPGLDPGPTSLAEELGSEIDDARAISAELGLRPHCVEVVRVHWSGGEVGRGERTERRAELVPRPKVEVRPRQELSPAGVVDRTTVVLSEVSTRYTEAELKDLTRQGALGPGDEWYFEISVDGRDPEATRTRYVLAEPPERRAFEWRLVLRGQGTAASRPVRQRYPAGP